VLIMNGDTFVERALYEAICRHAASPLLVVDSSRKHVADVKVHVEDRFVTHYGKEIAATVTAESTDIVKVNSAHTLVYRDRLERMIDQRYHDKYWEDVLMAESGRLPVTALDTHGLFWSEIDFIEDYQRVMGFTSKQA
jgi:choline kinase